MEGKTCHKCGSSEYLVKECMEIKRYNDYMKRASRYSKVYERYKLSNYRRFNNYRERYNNYNRLNEEQTRLLNEQRNYQLNKNYFNWELDETTGEELQRKETNNKGKTKL